MNAGFVVRTDRHRRHFHTNAHQVELHTNSNQASSGRAPTPTRPHRAEPPHRRPPGLIGQSLHTNTPTPTNASSGRAFAPNKFMVIIF